jgi:hypothetical protein
MCVKLIHPVIERIQTLFEEGETDKNTEAIEQLCS